jgi:hypothetical protein
LSLALAAVLALLLAIGGAPTSLAAPPDGDLLDYAVGFRRDFGLTAGEAHVQDTFQDPLGYPDRTWGLPLSEAEAADLEARLRWQTRLGDAIAYAESQPDYGGMYYDQAVGGSAVFRFTADLDRHRSAVASRAPGEALIEVRDAVYRMSDLERLKDEISSHIMGLRSEGIPVVQVDANARANRVLVSVERDSAGALSALRARYGNIVETDILNAGALRRLQQPSRVPRST